MPTYEKCPAEIAQMANSLLCEFKTHKPLLDARVRIDFVFAYADRDDLGMAKNFAIRFRGRQAYGLAKIIKLKDRVLGRADGEITLDGDWWKEASEDKQRALLDHELHHFEVEIDSNGKALTDDFSRPKLHMRRHDWEFGWFSVIAERHGSASQERIQAAVLMEKGGQYFWPSIARG